MAEYVCPEYVCADLSERPGCKVSPYWERRELITRCRDCINYSDEIGGYCELLEFANTDMQDGFCAWGSPREEDE